MNIYNTIVAILLSTVAAQPLENANQLGGITPQTNLTCFYKGAEYMEEDTILLEEPCLACTCQKGALVCSLRVCPKLPDPPPPGCVVVHKKNQCCPQITCEDISGLVENNKANFENIEPNKGCSMNGGLYSEGSALPSSTLCEFCFCMQGQQRCMTPHCGQPHDDCHPTYSPYSCCPVHYNCTQNDENYRKISSEVGCEVNGTHYQEGELVDTWTSNPCKTCYCIQGKVACQPVRCTIQHMEGCFPVYTHDRCCPVAYNCSLRESHDSPKFASSIDRSLDVDEPTTSAPAETDFPDSTSTFTPESTTSWGSTTDFYPTEEVNATDVTEFIEVTTIREEIPNSWSTNEFTTTEGSETTHYPSTTQEPEIVTIPLKYLKTSLSSNLRMENSNATPEYDSNDDVERVKPLTADEFLPNSTQADEDYESYDYSDAKLPPSLPNLVIFPFVAADAVTKEKEKYTEVEKKSDQVPNPAYYSPFFNPPVETQGGFVPKDDPIPDTATFQPIYFDDKVPIIGEAVEPIADHASIAMPPKPKSETCTSEGKEYKHGEELPQLIECISCVCLHGDIMCEEIICPEPAAGCHRSSTKPDKACCAPIVCEPVKIYTTPTPIDITQLPPNVTDIVLEPIISTDSSLSDVIKTEPAPDLPSLMGDILPFLMDQQTKKAVTVNYKNKVVNYYPKHQVTTTNDRQKTTLAIEDHLVVVSSTEPYDLKFDQTSSSPIYRPTQSLEEEPVNKHLSPERGEENGTSSEVPPRLTNEVTTVRTSEENPLRTTTEQVLTSTVVEKVPTLIGTKPKPTKPTTSTTEGSFFDEFLKGFFESNEESNVTKSAPSKMHHIYSSKIREPPILPTTTMASVEIIQNKEGEETETGSFSLDKVLDMLFQAEATEAAVRTTKPKNTTKSIRKPQRKTKRPTSTTVPTPTTTAETTTVVISTTTRSEPKTTTLPETSFVTDHNTGFPKINILEQVENVPHKLQEVKGHVSKQTESSRKPTKVSGGIGGMLKLAGCNIYGRMYRVGKIIAELTNACMECKCTESGVQCSKINC